MTDPFLGYSNLIEKENNMKAVYISHKPIYPKTDGGCVAMESFLKCLFHIDMNVEHIFLSTEKHPYKDGDYPSSILEKNIDIHPISINTKVTILGALKGLLSKGSYNVSRFHSPQMEEKINQLDFSKTDVVILESIFSTAHYELIRSLFKGKIIIRTHNVEHKIWEGYVQNTTNPLKKWYLKQLQRDIKEYEVDILNKVDGIFSISEEDSAYFKKLGIRTPIETIDVAVKIPTVEITQDSYENSNLFHLGAMNWQPNIEAVDRLMKLFPDIQRKERKTELHIAGKHGEYLSKQVIEGIKYHGFVDDLMGFCKESGILVTPLISGSGVKIKVLEMLAMGVPVITTQIGAQGIKHEDHKVLIEANTDQEIIDACVELINDKELRVQLGKTSVKYIKDHHNIETISQKIKEFIGRK